MADELTYQQIVVFEQSPVWQKMTEAIERIRLAGASAGLNRSNSPSDRDYEIGRMEAAMEIQRTFNALKNKAQREARLPDKQPPGS